MSTSSALQLIPPLPFTPSATTQTEHFVARQYISPVIVSPDKQPPREFDCSSPHKKNIKMSNSSVYSIAKVLACQDSSDMTLSHFSSKIFTASVNSTSGGIAPVDSMVTSRE